MLYVVQILLFGGLVILVLLRVRLMRFQRFGRLCDAKVEEFVKAADSVLLSHDFPEASVLAYRAKVLMQNARDDAELIASIRFMLGAVRSVPVSPDIEEQIEKSARVAIGLIHKRREFEHRWAVGVKSFPNMLDEKAIVTARARLLKRTFSLMPDLMTERD